MSVNSMYPPGEENLGHMNRSGVFLSSAAAGDGGHAYWKACLKNFGKFAMLLLYQPVISPDHCKDDALSLFATSLPACHDARMDEIEFLVVRPGFLDVVDLESHCKACHSKFAIFIFSMILISPGANIETLGVFVRLGDGCRRASVYEIVLSYSLMEDYLISSGRHCYDRWELLKNQVALEKGRWQ